MNAPAPARRPDGTVMKGSVLNPGGRPRSATTAIEELRERYLPDLPKYFNVLISLTKSESEAMRLAAVREVLDRLIGKPTVVVDSIHAKVDVGQLYLAALQRANQP
jgi:hypothetical protein